MSSAQARTHTYVSDVLLLLQPREDHLGARHELLGVLQELRVGRKEMEATRNRRAVQKPNRTPGVYHFSFIGVIPAGHGGGKDVCLGLTQDVPQLICGT